jgi:peptide/nickel transport system permease protein
MGGVAGTPPAGTAGVTPAGVTPAALTGGLRRHQWLVTLGAAARTRRGVLGLVLTGIVVLTAVIGPFVAPYSPTAFVTIPFAPRTGHVLLGGDVLGRDVLSRVLDGGWVLLLMAAAATAFGIIVGGAAGISAAYLRGRADGFIMRTVDVILAFPQLVFALLLVSIIGPKLWLIVIAVGISHAPAVARVLRSSTLDVTERDFVKSVELQGDGPIRVMTREILPNLVSPLMVEIGLRLTYSIVVMAGLSFLGFGQQPPAPNWGTMINENRIGLTVNPWGVIVPAALIAVLTIGTNTFTDAIARVAIGVERPPEEALVEEINLREMVAR